MTKQSWRKNIYWLTKRVSAAATTVIEVYSATYLLTVHTVFQWTDSSAATHRLRGTLQPRGASKMRNSAFSSHLPQTLSTKCCERSHYTTGVKIFAFITHLFEHWPRPSPAECCAGQLQPWPACHRFQIIYHLQLDDFSCHRSALWTLWESSWCIRGTKARVFIRECICPHTVHMHG